VCVVLATFWWAAPALLQAKYGYNYLPYTETATTTTSTTSLFEALRGSSYWLNYFDLGSPLLRGAWTLVTSSTAIVATAVVTGLGLAGLTRRIPERLFLVAGLTFGAVMMGIGYSGTLAGPFSQSAVSLLSGSLSPVRNVSKFTGDVALPLSLGLMWAVSTMSWEGVASRRRGILPANGWRWFIGPVAVLVVVLAAMPFWQRQLYPTGGFASIPSYWTQSAAWLDAHQGHQTSLLVPGATSAEYTWGRPLDEPLRVLTATSVTARSIIPLGSNGNTQMLSTVENVLATGTSPPGLAEYLARSGIDYVVERNDLNRALTHSLPPAQVHQVLHETQGLTEVASFGPYVPTSQVANGDLPVYDSASSLHLRAVEIFRVDPAHSEVQTFPVADPLVVSGSSGSLLPLAGAGLLTGRTAVLAGDPHAAGVASSPGATLAVTDGNQRRATSFGEIDDNQSYLLGPGQLPGNPVPGVPLTYSVGSGTSSQTVAVPIGASSVSASSYGSTPLYDEPSEGPAAAFDRDPLTAWVATATGDSVGQWVSITLARAVPLTTIDITPLDDSRQRPTISQVTVTTDRGSVQRSVPAGSAPIRVLLAPGRTRHLRITIDSVRPARRPSFLGPLGAGISGVAIPGVSFQPAMQLPSDELTAFAGLSRGNTVVSLDGPIANPNLDLGDPANLTGPLPRTFVLPRAMDATVLGTAMPAPGPALDRAISFASPTADQTLQVTASSWLGELPRFRPQNLVEKATSPWIAGINDDEPTLVLQWGEVRPVGAITLGFAAKASRPTELTISDGTQSHRVSVPPVGSTIYFPPMTTDRLTVAFTGVAHRLGAVPIDGIPITVPVGLSSIGLPGVSSTVSTPTPPTTPVDLPCGTGPEVVLDGTPFTTAISGTLDDLVDLKPVKLRVCAYPAAVLAAGRHTISFPSTPSDSAYVVTGLTVEPVRGMNSSTTGAARGARITTWTPDRRTVMVSAGAATYVQISQNYSSGWVATLHGRTLSPVRLDGWEQGWIAPAGAAGTVTMTFTPDGIYRATLVLGAVLLVALALLAFALSNQSRLDRSGPRRNPSHWLLAAGSALAAVAVGGWLALVLVPLMAAAYRWGSDVLAVVAASAFSVGGIVVAIDVSANPALHSGAFGAPAQVASMVALCAVLAAVVVEEGRRRRDPGQEIRTGSPGTQPMAPERHLQPD
jgi:arabinofuranan 3-O-arabinosyltransferase